MKKTGSESRKPFKWFRSYQNRYMKLNEPVKRNNFLSAACSRFNPAGLSDTYYANHHTTSVTTMDGQTYKRVSTRDNISLNKQVDRVNRSRTEIDYDLENIEEVQFIMSVRR